MKVSRLESELTGRVTFPPVPVQIRLPGLEAGSWLRMVRAPGETEGERRFRMRPAPPPVKPPMETLLLGPEPTANEVSPMDTFSFAPSCIESEASPWEPGKTHVPLELLTPQAPSPNSRAQPVKM